METTTILWILIAICSFQFIFILRMSQMMIKIANLLEEVRDSNAELKYIQLAKKRPPTASGDPSGLMDLDNSMLSYDPRILPSNQQNF